MSGTGSKFIVHLYAQIRVKVVGVVAENMAIAMRKADEAVNYHRLVTHNNDHVRLTDGMSVEHVDNVGNAAECAYVDPVMDDGHIDYAQSEWVDSTGEPLLDRLHAVHRKTSGYDKARLFMQELLDSVETLASIADEHGARTLADLMYLQQAILSGGSFDFYLGESKVMEIAQRLPSGNHWLSFMKVESLPKAA